jgi:hypothetical protein
VGHGARSRGSSVGKLVERFESAHGAHGEAKRCGWFKKTQEHYYIYNIYIHIYIIFVCCFYNMFLFEVWKRFEMSWNVNSHRIKNDFGRLGFCEARS